MAQFPYLLQAGFEAGATNFDSAITDTASRSLGYLHFTESVRKYGVAPYRGAYCWGINLGTGTATTSVYQTQAAYNISANNYWSLGTALYLKDMAMSTTSRHGLVRMMASSTVECSLDLYYTTAGGLQLVLDEDGTGTTVSTQITQNKWHWIELHGHCDNAGSNDGTASLVLNGITVGSLSSLDQGAFTDVLVGAVGPDSGTSGYIFFDDCYGSGIDTSAVRLGYRNRWPWDVHISAIASAAYGEHLFVGPGTVRWVNLLTTNSGDSISLYDTDKAYTSGTYANLVTTVSTATAYNTEGPFRFNRGCYAVITPAGANGARGVIRVDPSPPYGYPKAIYYANEATLKNYAVYGRSSSPTDA